MMDDLKVSPINYDKDCKYWNELDANKQIKTNINDLITYCVKHRPYMPYIKCK